MGTFFKSAHSHKPDGKIVNTVEWSVIKVFFDRDLRWFIISGIALSEYALSKDAGKNAPT